MQVFTSILISKFHYCPSDNRSNQLSIALFNFNTAMVLSQISKLFGIVSRDYYHHHYFNRCEFFTRIQERESLLESLGLLSVFFPISKLLWSGIVSILSLIFNPSSPFFFNPFRTIPSFSTSLGITVILIFHIFF